jgi:hypothetical protein
MDAKELARRAAEELTETWFVGEVSWGGKDEPDMERAPGAMVEALISRECLLSELVAVAEAARYAATAHGLGVLCPCTCTTCHALAALDAALERKP